MATLSGAPVPAEQRERLFLFAMALALGLSVVLAFSLFIAAGLSSFGAPWWVHIHAVTFMAWIDFVIVETGVVYRGEIALHRRLGRIGAAYVVWMVFVGLVLTPVTLAAGRSPPFFTPAYFLALDWVNIIVFAVLMAYALRLRRQTDWHRRLVLCATICVIAPAWGRLIVLAGYEMTAWANILPLLGYIGIAALADRLMHGRVHPAYLWGAGALIFFAVATGLLARFPPFLALADSIAS